MPDPNYQYHNGVLFLCMPKVANTSVKHALHRTIYPSDPVPVNPHSNALFDYAGEPIDWVVGFIRSPLDRFVSFYLDKIKNNWIDSLRFMGFERGMDIFSTLRVICDTPDHKAVNVGQHFRSQAWDLDQFTVDSWVRHCKIVDDWARLRAELDWLDFPPLRGLPHLNRSDARDRDFFTDLIYNSELYDALEERYRRDFEICDMVGEAI